MVPTMQSPIALESRTAGTHTSRASTSYHHMSSVSLVDMEWTVSAMAEPGGVMDLDGMQYTLIDIHSHTPAEHTIDGHRGDLETHLVHESAEGELAVLGVVFDAGDGRYPIDSFIGAPGNPPSIERLDRIVPSGSTTFRYLGSRTTPPYSPGIQWVVFSKRLTVGRQALVGFEERYGGNIRELQDSSSTVVTLG